MLEKKKRDPKKVVLIVVAVAISLIFLLMTVIPYLAVKFLFQPKTEVTYVKQEIVYHKPDSSISVSGMTFDKEKLNLELTEIEDPGLAVGTICLLGNEDYHMVVLCPEDDSDAIFTAEYIERFERLGVTNSADYQVLMSSYRPKFKDFIFPSPKELFDIINTSTMTMMYFDGEYIKTDVYDLQNEYFRFVVECRTKEDGENEYWISAFRVKDGVVTNVYSSLVIYDENCVLTQEQVLEFLSTCSYNPDTKIVDELETDLEKYISPSEQPDSLSHQGNTVIGEDHFIVFSLADSYGESQGYYAIDLTGTKAFKCSDDFKSTDEWVQLGKDQVTQ